MRALLILGMVVAAPSAQAVELGTMSFRLLVEQENGDLEEPSIEESREIFSLANCNCHTQVEVEMSLKMAPPEATTSPDNVQIFLGSDCAQYSVERDARCEKLPERPVQDFANRLVRVPIDVAHLVQPKILDGALCPETTKQQTVWALVDEGNDGSSYEHQWSVMPAFAIDTEPPPEITGVTLRGAEDGVALEWTLPSSRTEDIFGYQILCARADGSPIFATAPEAEYQTPNTVCGTGGDTFADLSPRFACTGKIAGSATSARVSFSGSLVAPSEAISVKIVAFDRALNPRGVAAPNTAAAQPVTDPWELYDEQGTAEPGFCAVTPGGRGGGGWLFVAFLVGALLVRRRLLVLAFLLVPVAAHAQSSLYEEAPRARPVDPPSYWEFEFKLGPYYPAIDDEPGLTGRPYETMFGTRDSILPQIGFERFFLHPGGELGAGLTLGYTYRTAHAFEASQTGMTNLVRASDKTAFHVVPMALSAVYRFTYLADNTVVPLVPYAKLGLAYYIWWFTKGGGDLAETPEGDNAIGATLGWQGTIGLNLRADAIDRDGIRDLGVDHIGFFFEFTYADVSGFGADTKLHVGDFNWAAGVNFEF